MDSIENVKSDLHDVFTYRGEVFMVPCLMFVTLQWLMVVSLAPSL